jgi:hypothetical protein
MDGWGLGGERRRAEGSGGAGERQGERPKIAREMNTFRSADRESESEKFLLHDDDDAYYGAGGDIYRVCAPKERGIPGRVSWR